MQDGTHYVKEKKGSRGHEFMFYLATLEAIHTKWRIAEHIPKFEYCSRINSLYSEKITNE